jgi:hypothetical protein
MKPRIYKKNGLWFCRLWAWRVGIGYSPRAAYEDWKRHHD